MGIATNVELHKLYEAAIAFRKLQPWKWMYASQLFIIHDDERDIDGFCSIMGMMGEHFSLSVYLEEAGYESYRYLYDKASIAHMDHIFMKAEVKKNCLTVSFQNPDSLTEHDEEQAAFLGYQFKEKNECPRFRYHHPGIYSWYLTDGWQCRFLTKALEQAMTVARLELAKELKVPEIYDQQYYLRYHDEEKGWIGKFIDASLYKKSSKLKKTTFQNDLLAYRIKKLPKLLITLEVIQFYLPNPVVEVDSGQPFFMLITALVDSEEGQLFYLDIQETAALYLSDTVSEFAKQLLELRMRPYEIIAEDEETYALLEDLCRQIDVKLSIGRYTARAHEFAEYIYQELQNSNSNSVKLITSEETDIDKLMVFSDEIINTLELQDALSELSESSKTHYKLIAQTFLLALYTIHNQIPSEWTSEAVKDICSSVLPEQLQKEILKEAKPVLSHFITVLGEEQIVSNYRSILLIINNYL
ncbi:hypothetical protein [Turicibacter sp. TJ11]|uniref:DUF7309 domain-containing protein n=1 Tax=Turicibacter sp. TJ11 TaxID=2806443 RepID=UPI001F298732|nr:hypothetical protein [Turicibacter sp. TJ11]